MTFSASDSAATDSSAPARPETSWPLSDRARQAFGLLHEKTAGSCLGLAVSGGSDSLALLVLAADHARAAGYQRLTCVTVDHGLRPEAAAEAAAVARACAGLGVEHHTLHWRPAVAGAVTQSQARRARHALIANWAREQAVSQIALGHTRDDRIETFLMRARQGSGWYGLAGPAPLSPSPAWPEGEGVCLMRPLLAFSRADLRALLTARGLGWAEDPSNANHRFERVRMRALSARLSPARREGIVAIMDRLAALRTVVMSQALELVDALEAEADGGLVLPLDGRRVVSPEAWRRFIETVVMTTGGAPTAARTSALDRLIGWIDGPEGASGTRTDRRTSLSGAVISIRPDRRGGRELCFIAAPPRGGQRAPHARVQGGVGAKDRARALLRPWDLRLLAV